MTTRKTQVMERRIANHRAARAAVVKREDGTESRMIAGYAAVFYNGAQDTQYELWSGVFERIKPGAFDESLKIPDDVRGLFNHDSNHILGRTGSGTMRLSIDKVGLRYEIDPPDTQDGRDILQLVERGDVSGSSFCFIVTDERWFKEGDNEIREILGVRLYDVGPVTFPAYDATTAGTRAVDGDLAEARASHERFLQSNKRERLGMDMDVRMAEVEAE